NLFFFFFFQAEDGIRDRNVTGVQTCALPISHEKLSMSETFRLFTEMGAYPTNEENIKGTISRGKLADMTVYSHDPFKMEHPDELLETNVEMTVIGGDGK